MPQRRLAVCTLVLAVASVGSLTAHHSLANHDTATPVRVKGTVVQFQRINPHSFIHAARIRASRQSGDQQLQREHARSSAPQTADPAMGHYGVSTKPNAMKYATLEK